MGAVLGIVNTLQGLANLGYLSTALNLVNAFESGNDYQQVVSVLQLGEQGLQIYSGILANQAFDALETGMVNLAAEQGALQASAVAQNIGNTLNYLAVAYNVYNLLEEDSPQARLAVVTSVMACFPPVGTVAAVFLSLFVSALYDAPLQEGQAQAVWQEDGSLSVVTTQDIEGAGSAANTVMTQLTQVLQGQVDAINSQWLAAHPNASAQEQSQHLLAINPLLLPTVGYQYDPDGLNISDNLQGHLVLHWVDAQGQEQYCYYAPDGGSYDAGGGGQGQVTDLIADFMALALGGGTQLANGMYASVPAVQAQWQVDTALTHLQQAGVFELADQSDQPDPTHALMGLALRTPEQMQRAHDLALAQVQADYLAQHIQGNTALGVVTDSVPVAQTGAADSTTQVAQTQTAVNYDATQHFNVLTFDMATLGADIAAQLGQVLASAQAPQDLLNSPSTGVNPIVQMIGNQLTFDTDGDGFIENTQWMQAQQGVVVIDLNADGQIDQATEFVHSADTQANGQAHLNSLQWLDANGDGVLNAQDPAFAALKIWIDVNQDGISSQLYTPALSQADLAQAQTVLQGLQGVQLPQGYAQALDYFLSQSTTVENAQARFAVIVQMWQADLALQADTEQGQVSLESVSALAGLDVQTMQAIYAALQQGYQALTPTPVYVSQHSGGAAQGGLDELQTLTDLGIVAIDFTTSPPVLVREVVNQAIGVDGLPQGDAQVGVYTATLAPEILTGEVYGSVQWVGDDGTAFVAQEGGLVLQSNGTYAAGLAYIDQTMAVRSDEVWNSDALHQSGGGLATVVDGLAVNDDGSEVVVGLGGADFVSTAFEVPIQTQGAGHVVLDAELADGAAGVVVLGQAASAVAVSGGAVGGVEEGADGGTPAVMAVVTQVNVAPILPRAAQSNSAAPIAFVPSGALLGVLGGVSSQLIAGSVAQPNQLGLFGLDPLNAGLTGVGIAAGNIEFVPAQLVASSTISEQGTGSVDAGVTPPAMPNPFMAASYVSTSSYSEGQGTGMVYATVTSQPYASTQQGSAYSAGGVNAGAVTGDAGLSGNGSVEGMPFGAGADQGVGTGGVGSGENGVGTPVVNQQNDSTSGNTHNNEGIAFDYPVVVGETLENSEDVGLRISQSVLLGNDTVVNQAFSDDMPALSIVSVGSASHGQVSLVPTVQVLADGSSVTVLDVVFVPDLNYYGQASFNYVVSDQYGFTSVGVATLNIAAVNDAPVAQVDVVAPSLEDVGLIFTPGQLLANDYDVDSATDAQVLHIAQVGNVLHGSAWVDVDGNIRFVPEENYHGPAQFSYWVTDGVATGVDSQGSPVYEYLVQSTVNLTITAVNDVPVAAAESITNGVEDTALVVSAAQLLANDTDVDIATDGQVLTISSVGNAVHGTVSLVSMEDGTQQVVFIPDADFNGVAQFSYTVADGAGGFAVATATVNVAAVNDAPVVPEDIVFGNGVEDTALDIAPSTILVHVSDVDNTATELSIVAVGNGVNGVVSLLANGQIQFLPDANFNGVGGFTYTVSDGANGFTVGYATVEVAAVNDAPVAVGESYTFNEDDGDQTFGMAQLLANDSDVDNAHADLTVAAVNAVVGGTVVLENGNIVFTPTLDFYGQASFTYTVSDGVGGSTVATVSMQINPVNDAPIAHVDVLTQLAKAGVTYEIPSAALLANDYDADADVLTVTSVGNAQNGTVALVNGLVTFIPTAGFEGISTFDYTASDGLGGVSTSTVTFNTVVNVNPVAVVDSLSAGLEDQMQTISVAALLANDSDADNAHADLHVSQISYDASTTHWIGYRTSDNQVVIVNLGATFEMNSGATLSASNGLVVNGLLSSNAQYGQTFNISASTINVTCVSASNGTLDVPANAVEILYMPTLNYNGAAALGYTVADGDGGATDSTALLTVNSVNDAPIIEAIWHGSPVYSYYHWEFVPGVYSSYYYNSYNDSSEYTPAIPPHWQLVQVTAANVDTLYHQTGMLTPPAGSSGGFNNALAGAAVAGIFNAQGAVVNVPTYQNGLVIPSSFSQIDAFVPPTFNEERGTYEGNGQYVNDTHRQHGRVIAYDPDGTGALTYVVSAQPLHGHAYANGYTSDSTNVNQNHTQISNGWVNSVGAWQYYSSVGDAFQGTENFVMTITDSGGASTSQSVSAVHQSWPNSSGKSCGFVSDIFDPIVIDLDGDGVELLNALDSAMLVMLNDAAVNIAWAASDDGVLVIDLNQDGMINPVAESNFTDVEQGVLTDVQGLQAYDQNQDGVLNEQDSIWSHLQVYKDSNSNGLVDSGELLSMGQVGVTQIGLQENIDIGVVNGSLQLGSVSVQGQDGHLFSAMQAAFTTQQGAIFLEQHNNAADIARMAQFFNQLSNLSVEQLPQALAHIPVNVQDWDSVWDVVVESTSNNHVGIAA